MYSALQKVKSSEDGPLGPGSDLLAALLGTFVLLAVSEREGLGVRPHQMQLIEDISAAFHTTYTPSDDGKTFRISTGKTKDDFIEIKNEAQIQHFYFGGNILFDRTDDQIKEAGKVVVKVMGDAIKKRIVFIKEIQIQGHADAENEDEPNLALAARRATSVFWAFRNGSNIDPHQNLMSITSFGEYKPVARGHQDWDSKKSREHNIAPAECDRNRRIEIILFYRTSK
jgi:outer membrane protein OmpA-like peptidoglycan-associated protein